MVVWISQVVKQNCLTLDTCVEFGNDILTPSSLNFDLQLSPPSSLSLPVEGTCGACICRKSFGWLISYNENFKYKRWDQNRRKRWYLGAKRKTFFWFFGPQYTNNYSLQAPSPQNYHCSTPQVSFLRMRVSVSTRQPSAQYTMRAN